MKFFKSTLAIFLILLAVLCSCSDTTTLNYGNESGKIVPENIETIIKNFDKKLPVEANSSKVTLPYFHTVFSPSGVETTVSVNGGSALPNITGSPAENSPIISDFSDMTYGNETISITGANLANATLKVWYEGNLTDITPLRSDDSKIQAVLPKNVGNTMMIVWPQNSNGAGSPIRVNAPEVWWADSETLFTNTNDDELCFYGCSLTADGKTPTVLVVHSDGTQELLTVKNSNNYSITASYPKFLLKDGRCKIYIHNGTGGEYGWSDALYFNVENNTVDINKLEKFNVDDYGAKANDGKDDYAGINRALIAIGEAGGGILAFGEGEYNLSFGIDIIDNYPKGLVLSGAGMGDFDSKMTLDASEYDKRGILGKHTSIRFTSPTEKPKNMFNINSNNITIRNMTINGYDDGSTKSFNVIVKGENISINKVRFVKTDLRDFSSGSSTSISVSGNLEIENSSKNISVLDCDFRGKHNAIRVGNNEGCHPWGLYSEELRVKSVIVAGCTMTGYTNKYTHPTTKITVPTPHGNGSNAIHAMNLRGGVFKNNTFQGYNREDNRILCRSIYCELGTKHTYIADNTMKNIGVTPETGFDTNSGEQILFHGSDDRSSIFTTVSATETTLTGSGGEILPGFDMGNYGSIFISSGKGAGQVRTVTAYEEKNGNVTFTLEKPFVIVPDSDSIVTLTAPITENIVYNNTIGNDKPILEKDIKSGGVLFFFQSYKNIVANNNIKNLSFGVVFNSHFSMPSYWSTVRGNKISGITEAYKDAMQGGDTTLNASFLCNSVRFSHFETGKDYWHTVGIVFRNNECSNGDTAAEIMTNRWHRFDVGAESFYGVNRGGIMTVFENNTFDGVAQGISISNAQSWALLRNNTFTFTEKSGYTPEELISYGGLPWENYWLLHIKNDEIIRDTNNTVNK